MRTHARVVVIGGGVVGLSTLYHLVRRGWSDVLLVERKELTSGSTWHAAGLLPLFNFSYSVGRLHKYSVALYKTLHAETGQDVGLRQVGNIRLACTADRMDEYLHYAGMASTLGVQVEFLSAADIRNIWPLCQTQGILGAIRHPEDGYIQPADLSQAFARGARAGGAEISRNTCVTSAEQRGNGEWLVHTDQGEIHCEHIVCATGNFARNTGEMFGLDIPVIPVEHQYLVTEPHPAIVQRRKEGLPEMGVLREPDASYYMREENGGLLLGPYEKNAPCCYLDGPAPNSEYELFQDDLDRLLPYIEAAISRVPAFGEVGIKRVYNGAIPYTPDGSPMIGPAWGKRNLWLNEGHSFGVTAAGGAGWQLAEWIVEGEPGVDMTGVDPRRFGPYATRGYVRHKAEEAYAKVFSIHYPDEERPASRPLKQAPCYDRMKALGAVFGSAYGWERPGWFAPPGYELPSSDRQQPETLLNINHDEPPGGTPPRERWRFRRSNYFTHVGNECRHVHSHVGLLDMTGFAKFEISGPGAETWLDGLFANRMPKKRGGISLCHMLTPAGGVRAETTIFRTSEQSFYLVSAGALERHDWDNLQKLLPADGSVRAANVTGEYGVFAVAGPAARMLLQDITDVDLGNAKFPWLTGKTINIGSATAVALRVNFVGELGWELHHPMAMQNTIFDLLFDKGKHHNLRPFGVKAMNALRLEKSYRLMGREMSTEYSAYESGLHRFIRADKAAFLGRESLLATPPEALSNRFVTLEIHDIDDADAVGSEPLLHNGHLAGRTTSGGFGWRVGKSLALAMVEPALGEIGTVLEIRILGKAYLCTVIPESPFDPLNIRLRS